MERKKRSQGTGEGVEALTLTGGGTLIEVSGKPADGCTDEFDE